jgi:hypothetical protein
MEQDTKFQPAEKISSENHAASQRTTSLMMRRTARTFSVNQNAEKLKKNINCFVLRFVPHHRATTSRF